MIEEITLLNEKLRRDMNDLADHIATGSCVDWPDYRYCVGKMEGFAIAERHLLDLRRQIEMGDQDGPDPT
jgi:hypothetical protein